MNKYQELLDTYCDQCELKDECKNFICLRKVNLQQLVDKEEKYRWKDSSDLPTTEYGMECLVALKTKGGNLTYDVLPDFVIKPASVKYDEYRIIAWKYIEPPFEEGEGNDRTRD